jgi:hypothetical protein
MVEPDYDNPPNFETFHECSEQKQWELYRTARCVVEDRNEEILQLKGMVASLRQSLELVQSRFVNEEDL